MKYDPTMLDKTEDSQSWEDILSIHQTYSHDSMWRKFSDSVQYQMYLFLNHWAMKPSQNQFKSS